MRDIVWSNDALDEIDSLATYIAADNRQEQRMYDVFKRAIAEHVAKVTGPERR